MSQPRRRSTTRSPRRRANTPIVRSTRTENRPASPSPGSSLSGCLKLILPIALIAVVVLCAATALFIAFRQTRGGTPTPPEQGSRATAAPVGTSTTVTDIGSGGAQQTSWYQLYFTAPIYPDNPANHKGGIDEKLVALIDSAKISVDVADYDFDLLNVADAMARASQRGVTVRMVTDSDTLNNTKNLMVQEAFGRLKRAGIQIVDDQRKPIMHNKFTVVDSEWISTGSWNYTDGDTYRLNNNMIIIQSKELAANYRSEFDKMFVQRQFGPTKSRALPNPIITLNGVQIETCFASEGTPASKCGDRVVATIGGAQRTIRFLAFSFTSDKIESAMAARKSAGVLVGGVFETTGSQTPFSAYGKLKALGADVYTDGNPWVMHHKVIIIDERIVIFGSYNFTDNADNDNDENLLIVDSPDIARAFLAEFDRVLALAKNPPTKK